MLPPGGPLSSGNAGVWGGRFGSGKYARLTSAEPMCKSLPSCSSDALGGFMRGRGGSAEVIHV